ncbi:MAG: NAD-dependent epimerase/dehydratase family protein [Bacteroidota bacterium]
METQDLEKGSGQPLKQVLVTGAAGFIGYHTCQALLAQGVAVTGLDNLQESADTALKADRLRDLGFDPAQIATFLQNSANSLPSRGLPSTRHQEFRFFPADIRDPKALQKAFDQDYDAVIHLAALVGVRNSIATPETYIDVNVQGFMNVLQAAKTVRVGHLVYASSSSVYGLNRDIPFSPAHPVAHPVSYYAATKKANELFAHTYAHLHGTPLTGLRFFTVYGPWGRQDMATYLFTRNIFEGRPIKVFNKGQMRRDFTFVEDIVAGILRVAAHPATSQSAAATLRPDRSSAPHRVYNIGLGAPVPLLDYIRILEKLIGKTAQLDLQPHQPGDLVETYADISGLREDFGYAPATSLEAGLGKYVDWFKGYYGH